MSKLKAATRNRLPASAFGLPEQRKYPMEDRVHQIKAEEFATKEQRAGKLSPAQAARIRAPAMRIAGQVVEEFEFAKDGEPGVGAEGLLEFGEGSDFVAQQVLAKDLGSKERDRIMS